MRELVSRSRLTLHQPHLVLTISLNLVSGLHQALQLQTLYQADNVQLMRISIFSGFASNFTIVKVDATKYSRKDSEWKQ